MRYKKIRVLFDANPLVSRQKSGIGYYSARIIEALAKNYPNELELVGHYFNFLGRKNPQLPTAPNIRYKSSKLLPGKVLSVTRLLGFQLPFELFIKSRGDIAFFPNYVSLPTIMPIKKVITVHDLCYEDHPEYVQAPNRNFLKKFVPMSVASADLIIANTKSTELAIQKHYKTGNKPMLITHIPPAKPLNADSNKLRKINLSKPFILFVSTLEPRKNYLALAEAYSQLPQNSKDKYSLVLVGAYGWGYEEPLEQIRQLKQDGNDIRTTGYVDEQTRAYFFKNASLFVMPSHYEGFGMTLLEAMSYGTPVAASDIPVFHEVAGPAAAYFDKNKPADIAKTMLKVLTDDNLRTSLKTKARNQLLKYDWDKVAADVMEKFEELTK